MGAYPGAPKAALQPHGAPPPAYAPQAAKKTSARAIAGFVLAIIGIPTTFVMIGPAISFIGLMLACDVQEEIERDPWLGPRGLNIATFWIVGVWFVLLLVVGIVLAAI